MKLVIAGMIIIFSAVIFFVLRPRDTAFHRNVRPVVTNVLRLILLIIFVISAMYLFFTVKKEGVGSLIANRGNTEVVGTSETEGDVMEVRVTASHIGIGKARFVSALEAREVLRQAYLDGKAFLLIDDYASAELYLGVKDFLTELGVNPDVITEIREP